jgi:hypothetical protein
MSTNTNTTNRNYPLPYPSNLLAVDVLRLRDALIAIDADMDFVQNRLESYVSVKDFMEEGVEDDSIAFNRAIDASSAIWIPPNTTLKCLGEVYPRSGLSVLGVRGSSVLEQYGPNLFVTNETLLNCEISGLDLVYKNPSPDVRHCAFKLQAHHACTFENFNATGYDDVTIFERLCQANDTQNCTFNKYANFEVAGCNTLDFAAGFEELQYIHIGDGATTVINTGTEWPEQFPSSVVVLKEDSRRILRELIFSTDYTVSYPSGILEITLTSPASSDERIWIYPSCPIATNRRPISNNDWVNCKSRSVKSRGHTAVRWLDAESYPREHIQLHQDNAVAYDTNPYETRGGQGGDYNSYTDSVITYSAAVTDPDTLLGWRLGPGSFNTMGSAIKMDLGWVNESLNRSLAIKDISLGFYELDGTVSITTGSKVVTGSNTVFTQKLSLIGAARDIVRIEGRDYGIASIDSDTQITLSTNAKDTLSGAKIYRHNPSDNTGYSFTFAGMSLEKNNKRESPTKGGAATSWTRTLNYGTITIPEGETSVTIDHGIWREFKAFEIRLTPASQLEGRSLSVNNITKDTFTVDVSTAGASCDIGYVIELLPLNLPES